MKPQSMVAFYALLMGVAILGMWAMFLVSGQTPELATTPVRFIFHLAAEFLTAVVCIAAGYGVLRGRMWGRALYLIAAGLLLYAVAQAAGYFFTGGDGRFATMFVLFALTTLGILWRLIQPQSVQWLLVFLGMVLYATIQTIGYFAQAGDLVATVMFVALTGLTLFSAFALAKPAMAAVQLGKA